MGTGPHTCVCVHEDQRETSSGAPQVLSVVFCFILFCLVLRQGVKMAGPGLGKCTRMAGQQILGLDYVCLPSTGTTNVSRHTPLSSL